MEKSILKKITNILMIAVLIFTMAGCGKDNKQGEDEENVEVPDIKEMIYKEKTMMLAGVEDMVTSFEMHGDKLYFMTSHWISDEKVDKEHEEELQGTSKYAFYIANTDGSNVKKIICAENIDKEFVSVWTIANDGGIVYVIGNLEGKKGKYSIAKIDVNGNEVLKKEVTTDTELNPYNDKDISLMTDEKGNIIIISQKGAFIFDENANFLSKVVSKDTMYCKTAKTKEGQIICAASDGERAYAILLDTDKKRWGKRYKLGFLSIKGSWDLTNGIEYDFYYNDESGIYGYDMGKEKAIKIVDYMASNLTDENTGSICPVEKDKLMGVSSEGLSNKLMIYDKVAPSDVEERKTIILGGIDIDSDLQTQVAEFNKKNKNYMIQVKDYFDGDNSIEKINADIIAGNVPDIIYLNDAPLELYAAKGLLEDLTPYYERDLELNVEDIIPAVLEGMKIDGEICFVSPSFGICTLAGRTEDVGNKMGWTYQDMQDILKKKGDDIKPFIAETKEELVYLMSSVYEDFIDWDTGECKFDSPEFKAILETINGGENQEEEYNENPCIYGKIKDGSVLLADAVATLDNVQVLEDLYESDITFIGYPNTKKTGSYFMFDNMLGMSSTSNVKEGIWEFLRTFMTKEYQDTYFDLGDVTRADSFEQMIERKMQANYYAEKYCDTHGTWWDYSVELKPLTKAHVDKYKDLVNYTKKPLQNNSVIRSIILEEAQAYFAGDKNVDETARIIQNRITTYVNESR